MKSSSLGGRQRKLPVFVFPEELQFSVEDESSHKQILTIYNPYEFNIQFQVLSNAPKRYAVVESQGSIKAHCCVDIVVRHKAVESCPPEVLDKFRVDAFIGSKLIGRKQVLASVTREKVPEVKEKPPSFVSLSDGGGLGDSSHGPLSKQRSAPHQASPSYLMMLLSLLCLLVLLLPLEGESPAWPHYSHVTVNQKLIAAFALGLLTMTLLKT
ncbi:motile sperm domain-containing protein 1-like [Halichondria panicea]|uniref:motile sperm domain-containing protein 1-like n=1 Tax=Halichondria panicea TaxID=6063 RepID=UPI00312B2D52